jgi:hypothetical protein
LVVPLVTTLLLIEVLAFMALEGVRQQSRGL